MDSTRKSSITSWRRIMDFLNVRKVNKCLPKQKTFSNQLNVIYQVIVNCKGFCMFMNWMLKKSSMFREISCAFAERLEEHTEKCLCVLEAFRLVRCWIHTSFVCRSIHHEHRWKNEVTYWQSEPFNCNVLEISILNSKPRDLRKMLFFREYKRITERDKRWDMNGCRGVRSK